VSSLAARALQHLSAYRPEQASSPAEPCWASPAHTRSLRLSTYIQTLSTLTQRLSTFRQRFSIFNKRLSTSFAEDACAVPKHPAAWPWSPRTQARRPTRQHEWRPSAGRGAPCRAHAARRPAAAERASGARRSGPRRARPSGGALLRRPPARAGLGVQHAVAGAPRAVRGRADLGAGGRRRVVRRWTVRPVRRRAKAHQVRAPPRPREPPEPRRARSKQLCSNPLSARRA